MKDFQLDKPIDEFCKPMIKGRNVKRYSIDWNGKWLLYDPSKLYRPAFPALFDNIKIVISEVTGKEGIVASYDDKGYYTDHSLCCCVLKYLLAGEKPAFFRKHRIKMTPSTIKLSKQYDMKYILGLINSRLLNFYYSKILSYDLNVYPESIEQIPIKSIDFANPTDKQKYDGIIILVEKMLALKKQQSLNKDFWDSKYNELVKEIEQTNVQIDELVCDLYGLTKEEKTVVQDFRAK